MPAEITVAVGCVDAGSRLRSRPACANAATAVATQRRHPHHAAEPQPSGGLDRVRRGRSTRPAARLLGRSASDCGSRLTWTRQSTARSLATAPASSRCADPHGVDGVDDVGVRRDPGGLVGLDLPDEVPDAGRGRPARPPSPRRPGAGSRRRRARRGRQGARCRLTGQVFVTTTSVMSAGSPTGAVAAAAIRLRTVSSPCGDLVAAIAAAVISAGPGGRRARRAARAFAPSSAVGEEVGRLPRADGDVVHRAAGPRRAGRRPRRRCRPTECPRSCRRTPPARHGGDLVAHRSRAPRSSRRRRAVRPRRRSSWRRSVAHRRDRRWRRPRRPRRAGRRAPPRRLLRRRRPGRAGRSHRPGRTARRPGVWSRARRTSASTGPGCVRPRDLARRAPGVMVDEPVDPERVGEPRQVGASSSSRPVPSTGSGRGCRRAAC